MHEFTELVDRCITLTIEALNEINEKTLEALETSATTGLVKTVQMIQLQKVILSVGIFSIFEAWLQEELNCKDGFKTAKEILKNKDEQLYKRFNQFHLAINVLKHGRGCSYDKLVLIANELSFTLKMPASFLNEGDVSEVSPYLIQVDDEFVLNCANIVRQISTIMTNTKHEK
jgi:hypothetical protein